MKTESEIKRYRSILSAVIMVLIFLFMNSCRSGKMEEKENPSAVRGILNITEWDFEKDGIAKLNGSWEIYWNQLLTPVDFDKGDPEATGFITVPGLWKNQSVRGYTLPEQGCATLRMVTMIKKPDKAVAIKIPAINSAYRLWINGELTAQSGQVGSSPENSKPHILPQVIHFTPRSSQIELILQLSSHHILPGGINTPFLMGPLKEVNFRREITIAMDLAIFGCLMFIYPEESWKRAKTAITVVSSALCAWILVMPDERLYSSICFEILALLATTYFLTVLIKAAKHKRNGSAVGLLGAIMLIATLITEYLVINGYIPSVEIIPIGLLLFIFAQSLNISIRLSSEYQSARNKENDLQENQKQLEETVRVRSAELTAILENSPFGIILFDLAKGKIDYMNPAFTQLTGYDRKDTPDLDFLSGTIFRDPEIGEILSGKREQFDLHALYQITTRKNECKNVDVFFSSFLNDRKSVMIISDVTLSHQLMKELEELNRTLLMRVSQEVAKNREKDALLIHQSRFAAMGEMIGNIAHQWRQPLNALNLLMANILDEYCHKELNEESMKKSVEKGKNLINKMSSTIDDFRNYFRPEKIRQFFDVDSVIRDTVALVEDSFLYNGIRIETALNTPVKLLGFPNEYSHVILNMLNNSRDAFTERNITERIIHIKTQIENNRSIAYIKDNAGGIDPSIMDRIFEPYFTTREEGKGTGIGLYMSRMIIEQSMNGRIQVENVNEGAEFRIIVPLPSSEDLSENSDTEGSE